MESWRPVTGFEGIYEVSDFGQVRSVGRQITVVSRRGVSFVRQYQGKILSPEKVWYGDHLAVNLCNQGDQRQARVHHLVLEAFVGPRPPGMFGLHRDDDPANNHLTNLYWGTKTDNQDDKVRNGNHHNTNKTQCPQGHDYDEENTRWETRGERRVRRCLTCVRQQARESYHRNK